MKERFFLLLSFNHIVIGALQYLGCFAEHVIWNYTIKRQMYRMNIALFKSLLQRVSKTHHYRYRSIRVNVFYTFRIFSIGMQMDRII